MSKTYRFVFPDGFSYVVKSSEGIRQAREGILRDYGFWARRGRDERRAIPLYWALDLHKQNYRFEECEDQIEGGNRRVRGPRSPEVRRKISRGKRGKSTWNKGGKWNDAQRAKLPGRKRSPETRRKISRGTKGLPAWNRGVPRTEEEKRKMSETQTGKWKWMTNGYDEVHLRIDDPIPPGWRRGRTNWKRKKDLLEIW